MVVLENEGRKGEKLRVVVFGMGYGVGEKEELFVVGGRGGIPKGVLFLIIFLFFLFLLVFFYLTTYCVPFLLQLC